MTAPAVAAASPTRTYEVRTYGCQMNVHDSERLAGLLEEAGYRRAPKAPTPTWWCSTRAPSGKRRQQALRQLEPLGPRKRHNPDMQIAVGGCLAQKDRDTVLRKAPWVDVVFGTHNIGSLPALLERARHNKVAQVEIAEALQVFPSTLPAAANLLTPLGFPFPSAATTAAPSVSCRRCGERRSTAVRPTSSPKCSRWWTRACWRSRCWARTSMPTASRSPIHGCPQPWRLRRAAAGVWAHRGARTGPVHLTASGGVHRRRHRGDGGNPNVCPALHMPLQSGSDRILRAMRRSYRVERYLGIIDRVRAAIPHAAITTDVIVGFPVKPRRTSPPRSS
ncbi:radical SAM superfamily protein [Mycobacterium xenopi 3993]|nr:radical SAM superfamily protein [Mycobacterium xenopi 3993]